MRIQRLLALALLAAGIAAAVVAVFFLTMWLGDSAALDGVVLQGQVREANSCDASASGSRSRSIDEGRTQMVASWILGLREGLFAGWTKQLHDSQRVASAEGVASWISQSKREAEKTNASADRMAMTLRLRRPQPFAREGTGASIDDFRRFVEDENQPTARGLAEMYSSKLCTIYKTGAYFGFSSLFRAAGPSDRNIFAAELKYYGGRAALPTNFLTEMVEPRRADIRSGQIFAADEQLGRQVAEYWAR